MKIKINKETGELLPGELLVAVDQLPEISIDLAEIAVFYTEPQKLLDKIAAQAGSPVFDINDKNGRNECKRHVAQIIRCISPALATSKKLDADYAKKIKQGINFRKDFEAGVRSIAAKHRAPLTEYEDEQNRLVDEQLDRENERLAAEKLELDWQDAIDLNELHDLRKARYLYNDLPLDFENSQNNTEMVTITRSEYEELLSRSAKLLELETEFLNF
jgi:hypothetical protein